MRLRGFVRFSFLVFPTLTMATGGVKDFTLPSATDSALIHLSDYAGKVVLINWWRTSCTWSQAEAPKLVALQSQYRDKGLVILGVSDDDSQSIANVPGYLKRYGITWPVGLNDQGEFMHEVTVLSARDGRPEGETPGNYIVSRSGQITYLGLDRSPEAWKKLLLAVQQALAEKPSASPSIQPRKLEKAPPLSLADLQGKRLSLSSLLGKPLVVNFFNADTCDWTGAVISKLYQDYSSRGLQVIGINLYDSDAAIQQCKAKYHANYPILRGDQTTQMAWIESNKAWATFFVTSDGKILKAITGSPENGIEQTVFPKFAAYLLGHH